MCILLKLSSLKKKKDFLLKDSLHIELLGRMRLLNCCVLLVDAVGIFSLFILMFGGDFHELTCIFMVLFHFYCCGRQIIIKLNSKQRLI